MKKTSDNLFTLIKSLSKAEKRQFKIFSSRYNLDAHSNYIKLFQVIEKQTAYNEKEIKRIFKNEKFIAQLSVTKNYLYHLILQCLQSSGIGDSPEAKIKDALRNVEVLYNKALYNQCVTMLEKAKNLAITYEKHLLMFEILDWEIKINLREADLKTMGEKLEELYEEENMYFEIYRNFCDFSYYARQMLY